VNIAINAISSILAFVLAASGIGKLLRLRRFRGALVGTYGIPVTVARPLMVAVPLYEIAASVLLLSDQTRMIGLAATGTFFLAVFFLASAAFLAGRSGDGGCFGELIDQRLGSGTLARLLVLMGLDAAAIMLALPGVGGRLLLPGAIDIGLAIAGGGIATVGLLAAKRAARAMNGE
jgi:hypothetical protein